MLANLYKRLEILENMREHFIEIYLDCLSEKQKQELIEIFIILQKFLTKNYFQMGDFFRDFLIGGISAAVLKTVFAPFHIIKLHTSHDYNKVGKRYKGIIDCFISFLREEGFAMWRGNLANVIRIFPVQALNFAFKDAYRKFFSPFDSKNEKLLFFLGNMASGSAAGAASLITFHPLDFGRTRLDADFGMKHKKKFTDLTNCLSKVYKSDGFIGLYRYFGVSVLQVSLFRGLKFGTYDTAKETIFQKKLMSNIFAKCIAYFITHIVDFISRPLDTIRRMMMQLKRADILYKNTLDCAVNIARKEGTQAFFKGPIYYKEYYSFVLVLYDESNQLIAQRSKSA
ncbi:unnamed protein product [Paramecium octaurelia]|uniref:ADP/ATP translocase n=1 Tax=Paramecium octaurelia TaxID=43137 RepID=A0A8S1SPB4_PAROT|nr:unnamed protein product [Paramecium octaurelia]